MKDEITKFFGNLENITDFSISKQIRKQTNNLDPNEFCKLSLEYKKYCGSRVFHEQMLPKKTDELSALEKITKNDPDFFSILPVKYYVFENGKIQQKIGAIKPNPRFNFNCKYLYYEFESFQNIMHELFEIIKSKETATASPQQPKDFKIYAVKKLEVKETVEHPEFDPNLWNKDCFELFKYLYDHYYKKSKRELTNIWFYLKGHTNDTFVLKATKDEYIEFIFESYHKKITNFDKAENKWNEKELPTLKDHTIDFKDTLK
ncbi:hypothetical protein [Flavobacterium aquicola]|uniref:Uncharacterized protein n=1 Tax=Flavobacterium aquicola TaxID=1682742 RepID=A0A3E0ED74_9FLAO|nr:hypothetical protein [Flavobacterium aquicola]REG96164.1 hypothetical protein C8P67_111138 [Flavobacterium aquicola]